MHDPPEPYSAAQLAKATGLSCGQIARYAKAEEGIPDADISGYHNRYFLTERLREWIEDMRSKKKGVSIANHERAKRRREYQRLGRWEGVTAKHQRVLSESKLTAAGKTKWEEIAKMVKLSPRELRWSIEKGRIYRNAEWRKSNSGGVATVAAIRLHWDLYMKQFGDSWEEWTDEECAELLGELSPLLKFCETMRSARIQKPHQKN